MDAPIPKLPTPKGEDFSEGILETIDLDSFRAEKRAVISIALDDEDSEVEPVPGDGGGSRPDPELQRLSEILDSFNALFGNVEWKDEERIRHRITVEVPEKVAADEKYQTAMTNNDEANAKVAMIDALGKVMLGLVRDETELFKQFSDNPDFKKWLENAVFAQTYKKIAA